MLGRCPVPYPIAATKSDAQRSLFGVCNSLRHSLQRPYQYLATHFLFVVGKRVGLGTVEAVGDGSRQTNPNQAFDVQL